MSGLKRLLGESGMLPQGEILDPRGQPEVGPGAGGEKTQLTRGWRTRGAGEFIPQPVAEGGDRC